MTNSSTLHFARIVTAAALLATCGCTDSKPSKASASKPPASKSQTSSGAAEQVNKESGASSTAVPDDEPSKRPATPKISAEAFRMAAYEGRLDSVRSAVESGMDVNGVDPSQSLTALHMAAYNGHTETVEYLVEHGATVDCRDEEGKTPLIHACTGPFAKSVEALIEAGADVNAREATEGFTPLMMAAGLGEIEVVKVLLEHNADKALLDEDQESASDHAHNSGHDEIVELLK